MDASKEILLWGCTPDSVLRLAKSDLQIYAKKYIDIYFHSQCHESLCEFLQYRKSNPEFGGSFIQVHYLFKLYNILFKCDSCATNGNVACFYYTITIVITCRLQLTQSLCQIQTDI